MYDSFEKNIRLDSKAEIPFEIRTTYHSNLLSEEDLREMIDYLETKNYAGNYYIQYFRNNVKTLSKLEQSHNKIDCEKLSTPTIKVVLRE